MTHQAMGNYDYDNVFNIVKRYTTPGSAEILVLPATRDLLKYLRQMRWLGQISGTEPGPQKFGLKKI
jgi:hypothetical protein